MSKKRNQLEGEDPSLNESVLETRETKKKKSSAEEENTFKHFHEYLGSGSDHTMKF